MQEVISKCFLNPEKNWRRSVLSFSRKTHTLILKLTSTSRRLGYSNNRLKTVNRLKNSFRPETDF